MKNEKQSSCKNNNIYTICDTFIELDSSFSLSSYSNKFIDYPEMPIMYARFCYLKPINNT